MAQQSAPPLKSCRRSSPAVTILSQGAMDGTSPREIRRVREVGRSHGVDTMWKGWPMFGLGADLVFQPTELGSPRRLMGPVRRRFKHRSKSTFRTAAM